MNARHTFLLGLIGFALVTSLFNATATAASERSAGWVGFPSGTSVAVTLNTGRVVQGVVDSRTTAHRLWLTASAEGMSAGSVIARHDVARVELAATFQLPPDLKASERYPQYLRDRSYADERWNPPADSFHGPIRSVQVSAQRANWDGDAQADGVRVWIAPLAANGRIAPTPGTVTVTLHAYRGHPLDASRRFEAQETWSREISLADFTERGAVLELPFRSLRPEMDAELLPWGVVSVRFSVPGEGVFDAVTENVELRSPAVTRDLRLRESEPNRLLDGPGR